VLCTFFTRQQHRRGRGGYRPYVGRIRRRHIVAAAPAYVRHMWWVSRYSRSRVPRRTSRSVCPATCQARDPAYLASAAPADCLIASCLVVRVRAMLMLESSRQGACLLLRRTTHMRPPYAERARIGSRLALGSS